MIPKRMRLTRDNLQVRGHVYRAGDVVEVHPEIAKEWIKLGAGVDAGDAPVTEPGQPRLRSEVIAEIAAARGPAKAERAVRQPKALATA